MRGVLGLAPGSRLTWSHVVSYQILPYLYSTTSHNVPTYMIGLLEYNSEGSTYVSEVLLYSVLCTILLIDYERSTMQSLIRV